MRIAIAVCPALMLALTGCFDFSVTRFGGEGAPCGESNRACREGFTCASDNRCTRDCEGCGALVAGDACSNNADCKKGYCVEGICCESECDGICSSCDEARTGRRRGICDVVLADAPPVAACGDAACDGSGSCRRQRGEACELGAQCRSGFCADGVCCESACDGLCESCTAALSGGLDGFCGATFAHRETADECVGPTACNGVRGCYTAQLGAECEQASECVSGFCADGRCCASACDGTCSACTSSGACNAVLSAEDVGTCDDSFGCAQPPCQCNASGGCAATGGTCVTGASCVSGFCSDGVCCDSACDGLCESCRASETGATTGRCAPIMANQDPSSECENGACDGASACQRDIGSACTASGQCTSGNCIDGLCCDNSCGGKCRSCRGADTGGSDGVCGLVASGTDPANECGMYSLLDGGLIDSKCDGAGACTKAPNGVDCTNLAPNSCASGHCVPWSRGCPAGSFGSVCCESSCTDTCRDCGKQFTGQSSGLCRFVQDGEDPLANCSGDGCTGMTNVRCNGAGSCTPH